MGQELQQHTATAEGRETATQKVRSATPCCPATQPHGSPLVSRIWCACRSLGQNFVTKDDILAAIVRAARIVPGRTVLEIGPGTGNLTKHLLMAGARVVAIEKDDALFARLRQQFEQARWALLVGTHGVWVRSRQVVGFTSSCWRTRVEEHRAADCCTGRQPDAGPRRRPDPQPASPAAVPAGIRSRSTS